MKHKHFLVQSTKDNDECRFHFGGVWFRVDRIDRKAKTVTVTSIKSGRTFVKPFGTIVVETKDK